MDGRYELLVAEFIQSSPSITLDERSSMMRALERNIEQCAGWGLYKAGCLPDVSAIHCTAPDPQLVTLRDRVHLAFTNALCDCVYDDITSLLGTCSLTVDGNIVCLNAFIEVLSISTAGLGVPCIECWFVESAVGVKCTIMDEDTPLWVAYTTIRVGSNNAVLSATYVTCVHT